MDTKGIVAVAVVLGSFGLVAPYVIRDQAPDALVLAFVTGALMLVLGFYFGHINGSLSGLASATSQLATLTSQVANQALEKRAAAAAVVASVTTPPAAVPQSTTGGSSNG